MKPVKPPTERIELAAVYVLLAGLCSRLNPAPRLPADQLRTLMHLLAFQAGEARNWKRLRQDLIESAKKRRQTPLAK